MLCVRVAHTQHTVPCFSVNPLFSGQSRLDIFWKVVYNTPLFSHLLALS